MYDERQLKGELSQLFAVRLLYKLSISPGCKYCGAQSLSLTSPGSGPGLVEDSHGPEKDYKLRK